MEPLVAAVRSARHFAETEFGEQGRVAEEHSVYPDFDGRSTAVAVWLTRMRSGVTSLT